MGFFSNLVRPSHARFARLVTAELRSAGYEGPIAFDESCFKLTLGEGKEQQTMFLGNVYNDYCCSPRSMRRTALRRFVSAAVDRKEMPAAFDAARPNLLPRVRDLAYYELTRLALKNQGYEVPWQAFEPICDHLGVEVCYDTADAIAQISAQQLEEWGVSLAEALKAARDNLWKISNEAFESPLPGVPGLYVSPWRDNHDASRMFLHDLIWQLEVKGDHVVLTPGRDVLIVTGSEDEAGLLAAAAMAEKALGEISRPMTGLAARLDGTRWVPFMPPADHPAYPHFRVLQVQSLGRDYAEQKQLLEEHFEMEGSDVFIASYSPVQDNESKKIITYAVWSQGEDTLLPKAEYIAFGSINEDDEVVPLGLAPWARVMGVMGNVMEPREGYPPRYRVRTFPTRQQLEAMKLCGMEDLL